jgi:cell division protein FtsA
MVLTGGASALPGIKRIASEVLGMPVRVAQPENLSGLVDRLNSPAYSTSVGLLRWVVSMQDSDLSSGRDRRAKGEKRMSLGLIKKIVGRILP